MWFHMVCQFPLYIPAFILMGKTKFRPEDTFRIVRRIHEAIITKTFSKRLVGLSATTTTIDISGEAKGYRLPDQRIHIYFLIPQLQEILDRIAMYGGHLVQKP